MHRVAYAAWHQTKRRIVREKVSSQKQSFFFLKQRFVWSASQWRPSELPSGHPRRRLGSTVAFAASQPHQPPPPATRTRRMRCQRHLLRRKVPKCGFRRGFLRPPRSTWHSAPANKRAVLPMRRTAGCSCAWLRFPSTYAGTSTILNGSELRPSRRTSPTARHTHAFQGPWLLAALAGGADLSAALGHRRPCPHQFFSIMASGPNPAQAGVHLAMTPMWTDQKGRTKKRSSDASLAALAL